MASPSIVTTSSTCPSLLASADTKMGPYIRLKRKTSRQMHCGPSLLPKIIGLAGWTLAANPETAIRPGISCLPGQPQTAKNLKTGPALNLSSMRSTASLTSEHSLSPKSQVPSSSQSGTLSARFLSHQGLGLISKWHLYHCLRIFLRCCQGVSFRDFEAKAPSVLFFPQHGTSGYMVHRLARLQRPRSAGL